MPADPKILSILKEMSPRLSEELLSLTPSELLTHPIRLASQSNSFPRLTKNGFFDKKTQQIVWALTQAHLQNLKDFRRFAYYTVLRDYGNIPPTATALDRGNRKKPTEDLPLCDERQLLYELIHRKIIGKQQLQHFNKVDISVPGASHSLNMGKQYVRARDHLLFNKKVYPGLDSLVNETINAVLHKVNSSSNKKILATVQRSKLSKRGATKLAIASSKQRYVKGQLPSKKDFKLSKKNKILDLEGFALLINDIIPLPHAKNYSRSQVEQAFNYFNNKYNTNPYLSVVSGLAKNFYVSSERAMEGLQFYIVPTQAAFDFGALQLSYPEIVHKNSTYTSLAISVHIQAYTEYFADKIGPTSHLLYNRRKESEREKFLEKLSPEASLDFTKWEDYFLDCLAVK